MITDNILQIEFSRGRLKLDLSAFLPAKKTDLKKVFQMIDRTMDPSQIAEELAAYITTRLQDLPDSNYYKKDREKLSADLSCIADYYGLQNIPDLTDDKPKLKTAPVYTLSAVRGKRTICQYAGVIFTLDGVNLAAYRRDKRSPWNITEAETGCLLASADKRTQIIDKAREMLPRLRNLITKTPGQYIHLVNAFRGEMQNGYVIMDSNGNETGRGSFDVIPDPLEDLQPAPETIPAKSSDNEDPRTDNNDPAEDIKATDDAERKQAAAFATFDAYTDRYKRMYKRGLITWNELCKTLTDHYDRLQESKPAPVRGSMLQHVTIYRGVCQDARSPHRTPRNAFYIMNGYNPRLQPENVSQSITGPAARFYRIPAPVKPAGILSRTGRGAYDTS